VTRSGPAGAALDGFLKQPGISPFPTRESNTSRQPLAAGDRTVPRRFLTSPPAEGRPPGEGWAHQRWNEFYPQAYFKTVQAGARVNGGIRDNKQLHGYAVGEFGPGGLYYNTADNTCRSSTARPRASRSRSTRTCRCRTTSRCGPSTARCRRSC
jgi:hypothetical protein